MYDIAITSIQRYMDEHLFEPGYNWPSDEFIKRSYSRWIADEIIDRIIFESNKLPQHISGLERLTPLEIINEMVDDLDYCSGKSYYGRFQNIFNVAKETAIDISMLFL